MCEDELGKVMSGVETAPTALEKEATQPQRTQYTKESRRFDEKNCKLFARMLFGYDGFTRGVWQCHGPSHASVRSGRDSGVWR